MAEDSISGAIDLTPCRVIVAVRIAPELVGAPTEERAVICSVCATRFYPDPVGGWPIRWESGKPVCEFCLCEARFNSQD